MANVNRVILLGRLTREPELHYTQGGTAVTEIGLAVNRKFKKGDGSDGEEVLFIDVVAWQRLAEVICQYVKKGSQVYIEGRLRLEQWEDRTSGEKKSKIKVVAENVQFLDGRPAAAGDQPEARGAPRAPAGQAPRGAPPSDAHPDEFEEEVPF